MDDWKQYTFYNEMLQNEDVVMKEDDNNKEDDLTNIKFHAGENQSHEIDGDSLCPINNDAQLKDLVVAGNFLNTKYCANNNRHIKLTCKEDEDFIILSDEAWNFLSDIYGGRDIPRYSIEADKEENATSSFFIEIYLKSVLIYILPKIKSHLYLKDPTTIYISRKATIK